MGARRAAVRTLIFQVGLTQLLTQQVSVLLVAVVNIQQYLLRLPAYKARRSSNAWLVSMCDKGGNIIN